MTDTTTSSSTSVPSESTPQRPAAGRVAEYVISWKWLLGGLIVFLCCGSAVGGLYYYRTTTLSTHVLEVASQMVKEADVIKDKAEAETDEAKKRDLFKESYKMKEGAAKLLDNFNRSQEGHTTILKELNSVLESLYKDEGGARAPGGGRERSKQIMDNCVALIQALASEGESLPYRIRLMELAWDRRDLPEVLSRAKEVLNVERALNKPDNYEALRYVALASIMRLPVSGYNPILLQMPFLDKELDKLLEKVYFMKPSDIEIASRYAEFIIDVNRDTFKRVASDSLLREMTPENRREKAISVINDMVSRNASETAAYLTRFQFRIRYLPEPPLPEDLDPDLKMVLKLKPDDADGLIRAAMYTFQQLEIARRNGDTDLAGRLKQKAEEYLTRNIAHNERFGLGYQYLGDYLIGEGKADEAIKVWNNGLEKAFHPAPEELIGRLAVTLMELKRFEEADSVINKLTALALDSRLTRPGATNQIRTMGILLGARLNATEGTEAIVKAEEAQIAGREDEARRLYSLSRRKTSDALNSLDSVLKTFGSAPHDYVLERTSIYGKLLPESLMMAGRLMADITKWDRAAKYYEVTIPFPLFREAATIAAANAYQHLDRPVDAVRLMNAAVQQSPNNMSLRYIYMRSLFQQQAQRNDVTPESLDAVEKQLLILQEHRDELPNPWTVDLRMVQLEMLRATITNDPEKILEAQLAATRKYRELEKKEFPVRPGDEESDLRVYSDDLGFLSELANIYSTLAALSDFDRLLLKMREMPGGESAYFAARVNDALGRNDREGAKLVIEEALESDILTAGQKQRFVLLMRNLNEESPDSMERIYASLKSSYELNPDQLKPQAFFLLANMAIDRDDLQYAKVLQERLGQIEGAPEEGTWWRYIQARLLLTEPEPNYDNLRQIQEAIIMRRDTWDQAYLLRASIEESFFAKNPDNREARGRIVESLQMALRCGNTQPQVWNRLLSLYEEDGRSDDAKQLRRDALVRGIQLDSRTGQFPQPYQRMYVQVSKSIQEEDPQNADVIARQCLVLARSRNESPDLIFSLNMALGSLFFDSGIFESAERHLNAVAKRGGSFVYPLAVCLAKNQRVDEGFGMILDEINRMPSSAGELVPSLLILLSQVRPSEAVFQRVDKLMERIERGERPTSTGTLEASEDGTDIPLGERRIRTMAIRFPTSDITPDPAHLVFYPPMEDFDDEESVETEDTAAEGGKAASETEIDEATEFFYSEDFPEPTITPIKGGYYVVWPQLTTIGGFLISGPLTGSFEIQYDLLAEDIGKQPRSASDPDILLPLADYWIVRGKPELAIPMYRLGLEKAPDNLLFLNNLAMLLSSVEGKHSEALGIIDSALTERRDNVTLLDTKGLILLQDGRADEAIPQLERAVELSCQHPIYCLHLAKALDTAGRENSARNWFDKARPLLEASPTKLIKENKEMFDDLRLKYGSPAAQ